MNYNYAGRLHRDAGNAGPSLTRSLGQFIGGALRYYPDDDGQTALDAMPAKGAEVLNTRASFVLFDGTRGHSVNPFVGSRYSIVYFTISSFEQVPLDQRRSLTTYPTPSSMRALRKMLAPPRGYANGRRQRSIQQAFGFAGKVQALRWEWGQLPPDVLLRIALFADVTPTAVLSKEVLRVRVRAEQQRVVAERQSKGA